MTNTVELSSRESGRLSREGKPYIGWADKMRIMGAKVEITNVDQVPYNPNMCQATVKTKMVLKDKNYLMMWAPYQTKDEFIKAVRYSPEGKRRYKKGILKYYDGARAGTEFTNGLMGEYLSKTMGDVEKNMMVRSQDVLDYKRSLEAWEPEWQNNSYTSSTQKTLNIKSRENDKERYGMRACFEIPDDFDVLYWRMSYVGSENFICSVVNTKDIIRMSQSRVHRAWSDMRVQPTFYISSVGFNTADELHDEAHEMVKKTAEEHFKKVCEKRIERVNSILDEVRHNDFETFSIGAPTNEQ